MIKGLKVIGAVAAALAVLSSSPVVAAAPAVSGKLAKPLKAAQDALTAHDYSTAIAKVHEAEGMGGATAYDTFVMDSFLMKAYVSTNNYGEAAPLLEKLSHSQYSTPEQQRSFARNVPKMYYELKQCGKVVDTSQDVIKRGFGDTDTYLTIAQCQQNEGHYKEAATTLQSVIGNQDRPPENLLKAQYTNYSKAGDAAAADKVMDRLVTVYPKPEYWGTALVPLMKLDVRDSHLQLNIYRLMYEVGVLKAPSHFGEMAGLALEQGYPGEAQSVLERAMTNNVFTEQRDKDRYQHTLDAAKARAAKDKTTLAQSEASAKTADAQVQIGAAYLSYGQPDKAASVISAAIAKGGLKYPDEANILLGVAQFKSQHAADAEKTFNKEAGAATSPAYARLAKLWALHVHG